MIYLFVKKLKVTMQHTKQALMQAMSAISLIHSPMKLITKLISGPIDNLAENQDEDVRAVRFGIVTTVANKISQDNEMLQKRAKILSRTILKQQNTQWGRPANVP